MYLNRKRMKFKMLLAQANANTTHTYIMHIQKHIWEQSDTECTHAVAPPHLNPIQILTGVFGVAQEKWIKTKMLLSKF